MYLLRYLLFVSSYRAYIVSLAPEMPITVLVFKFANLSNIIKLLLPFKYREVLLLHYVEGYQGREIAGMLGLSESAVRKRLERGREKLRGLLQETG